MVLGRPRSTRSDTLFPYTPPFRSDRLRWDAPGAPDRGRRVADLLAATGIASDEEHERGWDHGVFVPMKVMAPEAEIPLLQLSLRADLDPAAHIAIGRALAPLRDEGVLIVGSGMSFHNLRARGPAVTRSEEHTSELQSLMRISYAVFCLKKKNRMSTTS